MQTVRLAKDQLPALLDALRTWGAVWGPVERAEGVFAYEELESFDHVRPDALRTVLPAKKLLLAPEFTMLEGAVGGAAQDPSENDCGPTVLFGLHACDIHSLQILDLLYLSDYVDESYRSNRDQMMIVGYGCWPDERCFCHSLGTSTVDEGFDLFLTPLEDRYLVAVGSTRGDDVVRANPDLFQPSTRRDTLDYLARLRHRREAFRLHLDVTDLPYVLELRKNDPVWDELGNKCLCCGSCSQVCPTCSCFNVSDRIDLDGTARRVRTWDACLFRDYAMVAGGHNFRPTRADRVKNRYYHKQEAFVREFGRPSCVGCGRCIENCPTAINVVEVFNYVRGEL